MSEDDIRQYFEQFGKIEAVTRLTEKDTGKPRGFGFVEFDDYDPVDKAILKGNHQINGKRVDVKKAVSKQEMNSMGGGPGGMRGGGGGGSGRRVSKLHYIPLVHFLIRYLSRAVAGVVAKEAMAVGAVAPVAAAINIKAALAAQAMATGEEINGATAEAMIGEAMEIMMAVGMKEPLPEEEEVMVIGTKVAGDQTLAAAAAKVVGAKDKIKEVAGEPTLTAAAIKATGAVQEDMVAKIKEATVR